MAEQSKSYYKNFVLLFTGNSVSQIIPFLLAPVISRIFSPQEFSVQENFLAMVALISVIAAGRFEIALILPKLQKKANNLFALALLVTICVSILSLSAMLFPDEIANWYKDEELGKYIFYLAYLAPAVFLLTLNNILTQWIIRAGKYSLTSASKISQSITQNGGYALLGYFGWGINGLIIAWLIGNLLPSLLLLSKSFDNFKKEDVSAEEMKAVAKEYKDFPMINSLHAFTDIFATQFLLFWLITRNYGALCLGLFAVMNRYLKAPFNLIGTAVGQLYYREASNAKNENTSLNPIFNRSVLIVSAVTLPAMLIVFFFGADIFAIYLGEKWRDAGTYASIMAPAMLFNFIVSPVSATPVIFQKQKTAYIISLAGYIVSLGSIFIATTNGYDFRSTLIGYSATVSVFYIVLLLWYRILIKQK